MNFALISVLVNIGLGASLFFGLRALGLQGYVGLAIAASVSGWANALLLGSTLLRERIWRPEPWVIGKFLRIAVATAAMATVLGIAALNRVPIEGWFEARLVFGKEVATLLVCLLGAIVYAAIAFLVRAVTMADIKLALQKPAGAPAASAQDEF
jgi:putative peptidoglycan lipid II flippase